MRGANERHLPGRNTLISLRYFKCLQGSHAGLFEAGAVLIFQSSNTRKGHLKMTNTSKFAALALTAVVALGSIAAPAIAGQTNGSKNFDGDFYVTQLRYDGVNAIAADEVTASVFRATVIGADGHQAFEFFDRDSLVQIKQ